jgi:hypothetical protein
MLARHRGPAGGEGKVTLLQALRLAVIALMVGGLAVFLTASLSTEFKTGIVKLRGGMRIARRKSPTMYWLTFAVQVLFLAASLYVLSRLIPDVVK